ncbi:MliC family protein [Luteimonas saliphila]|uniref:MliC family protein n=1 Tax=Luteimonas saliphila TaxID=2804919 RepID=UPI00192D303F|nr:MliC family protein [Luteimonas saliphila]
MRALPACTAILALLLASACSPDRPAEPAVPEAEIAGQTPAFDTPSPMPGIATTHFRCGDLLVGAEFDNAAGHVTLSIGTARTRLSQAVAASGARYADTAGNEFWNKGDGATLTLDGVSHTCTVTEQVSPWQEARSRGAHFRGLGTEPFWSLEVEGGPAPRLLLDLDMGERRLVVAQLAPLDQGEGFAGRADDGSEVTLRIARSDCSDGMSDERYPASIDLTVGGETYAGCGAFLQE